MKKDLVIVGAGAAPTRNLLDALRENDSLRASRDQMRRERDEAVAEAEACDVTRDRMRTILERVAVAMRGQPPENGSWGWADLGERAEQAVRERDEARRAAEVIAEALGAPTLAAALVEVRRLVHSVHTTRRAAIEECARVCDDEAEACGPGQPNTRGASRLLAARLRALLGKEGE